MQGHTRFRRRIHKDGKLDAVFLCRADTRHSPCESHKHAVERRRDAHRQSIVNDGEACNQLVRPVVTAIIYLQCAISRRLNVHLQDIQCQPVSIDCPEQLQTTTKTVLWPFVWDYLGELVP